MKVIIIGGGSSGMVSAIISKRCGNEVTIIEKNNILGKKLILTGNGRCNYFNDNMSLDNYYNIDGIDRFINNDNIEKVKSFFDSIGIVPKIKDGLYYPYSNTSYSIQNSLLKEINVLNIKIINEEVIDIKKEDDFTIKTNNGIYHADKVILSTGGITYPKTGSDGFGYNILSKLGHNIISPRPALVPLVTNEKVSNWKGIRTNVKASLYVNDRLLMESNGEAQLTDYGISGICIMNLSRYVKKNNKNTLVINFLPDIENVKEFIENRNKHLKERSIIELLEVILNYKLLYFILDKLKINSNIKWEELSDNKKDSLIDFLTNYKLNIIDTKGIDYGEVTTGGVPLDEVCDNCESKYIKNLFITGELLDIDGICGGYNLTNAWITGFLAGESND